MTILEAALDYRNRGFSIIPTNPNKDSEGKIRKNPLLSTWSDYQKRRPTTMEIENWLTKWPNAMIGVVTGTVSNLFVLDCDDNKALEFVSDYLPETLHTPIVATPRGGRHFWFQYPEQGKPTVATRLGGMGLDYRGQGGYIVSPPSINCEGKVYRWLDGCSLSEVGPQALPNGLYNKLFLLKGGSRGKTNLESGEDLTSCKFDLTNPYTPYKILQEGSRDNDLFKIGMSLADGHCAPGIIFQVLEILALSAHPAFPVTELPNKLKSILQRLERKERNLAEEVREYFSLQKGYTELTDLLHYLQILTREEKNNLYVILNRLVKDGIIEKYGEKRGRYRPVEKEENLLQFIEDEIYEYPVKLPLGLNDQCRLYPQNIIVLAGSKSAGKTAVLMDIAFRNQDNKPIVYLNSEMGSEEWTSRCKNHGISKASEINFKCVNCHSNFHDKIDGSDTIYLIDFMEIHENFYEIAKHIRAIHEKLGSGICFIAIQKKFTGKLARGAEFSMEKARLYLALDYLDEQGGCTKVTIVDAKAPKPPGGVRGYFKRIKIIGGTINTVLDREWRQEIEQPQRRMIP